MNDGRVLYVGVDVDDNAFNLGVFCPATGELESFKTGASPEFLKRRLAKLGEGKAELRICYEATYVGFSLARKIKSWGWSCEVIAPSLIPKAPGHRVKTDRLDALKLARLFASNMLTLVRQPTEEEESHRRLIRSRRFLVGQASKIKNRITSICRTLGLNYREQTEKEVYWTPTHRHWLKEQCALQDEWARFEIQSLLNQLEQSEGLIDRYNDKIENLAKTKRYLPAVKALTAYRAIDTLSAMTAITEIFAISRFAHPKQLMSYAGLDIAEYSSGGKEMKFSITKMGNRHLRTTVVEACQFAARPPRVSRDLASRRKATADPLISIADRCMARLSKKGSRLIYAGKHKNKVKVALAREMLGFFWESLKQVQGMEEIKH